MLRPWAPSAVAREITGSWRRWVALVAGIAAACTGFTLLTTAAETQRLAVVGTVQANARSVYNVLVRPKGSRTAEETSTGAVRGDFLAGQFGGITMEQLAAIRTVPGVEVAAPLQLVGYVPQWQSSQVDVTPEAGTRGAAVVRVGVTWSSDRGTSTAREQPAWYAYVTPNTLQWDGSPDHTPRETLASRRVAQVCAFTKHPAFAPGQLQCWSRRTQRSNGIPPSAQTHRPRRVSVDIYYSVPLLVAAVDPAAEAKLTHLDRAVVKGRWLRNDDAGTPAGSSRSAGVPAVGLGRPALDLAGHVSVEVLPTSAVGLVRAGGGVRELGAVEGRLSRRLELPALHAYPERTYVAAYWTATSAAASGQPPRARLFETTRDTWSAPFLNDGYIDFPRIADDHQWRPVTDHPAIETEEGRAPGAGIDFVGEFDVARLPAQNGVTEVPLGLTQDAVLTPSDDAASAALRNRPLLPSAAVGSFQQQPPSIITTLAAAEAFRGNGFDAGPAGAAPLSSIRVRVAGVTGVDAVSRERVRLVAEDIVKRTGLDVDVTAGSSPTAREVVLPAGRFGRPELHLDQAWVKKGVAAQIVTAIDAKSLVLFVLVLLVSVVFVANSAAASVQARRRELGLRACLGWTPRQLTALVLGELLAAGVLAGAAASAVALAAASPLGTHLTWQRALLALPAAVLIAVLAGLVPAVRAGRAVPLEATRPVARTPRQAFRTRGITSLAIANVRVVPGRALLAAGALAVGIAALTVLVATTLAFHGALVGSLLGDVVSVQVRTADWLAVVATLVLAAVGVGDVLYLNAVERSAELATLRATGWTPALTTRLIATEGAVIGIVAGAVGVSAGLAAAWLLAGPPGAVAVGLAAGGLAVAVLVAVLAAAVPAAVVNRLPLPEYLAAE